MAINYQLVAAHLRATAENMELDAKENYPTFARDKADLARIEDRDALLEAARLVEETADEVENS